MFFWISLRVFAKWVKQSQFEGVDMSRIECSFYEGRVHSVLYLVSGETWGTSGTFWPWTGFSSILELEPYMLNAYLGNDVSIFDARSQLQRGIYKVQIMTKRIARANGQMGATKDHQVSCCVPERMDMVLFAGFAAFVHSIL